MGHKALQRRGGGANIRTLTVTVGQSALAVDLDSFKLRAASVAGRVAAGLRSDVARITATDPSRSAQRGA